MANREKIALVIYDARIFMASFSSASLQLHVEKN